MKSALVTLHRLSCGLSLTMVYSVYLTILTTNMMKQITKIVKLGQMRRGNWRVIN